MQTRLGTGVIMLVFFVMLGGARTFVHAQGTSGAATNVTSESASANATHFDKLVIIDNGKTTVSDDPSSKYNQAGLTAAQKRKTAADAAVNTTRAQVENASHAVDVTKGQLSAATDPGVISALQARLSSESAALLNAQQRFEAAKKELALAVADLNDRLNHRGKDRIVERSGTQSSQYSCFRDGNDAGSADAAKCSKVKANPAMSGSGAFPPTGTTAGTTGPTTPQGTAATSKDVNGAFGPDKPNTVTYDPNKPLQDPAADVSKLGSDATPSNGQSTATDGSQVPLQKGDVSNLSPSDTTQGSGSPTSDANPPRSTDTFGGAGSAETKPSVPVTLVVKSAGGEDVTLDITDAKIADNKSITWGQALQQSGSTGEQFVTPEDLAQVKGANLDIPINVKYGNGPGEYYTTTISNEINGMKSATEYTDTNRTAYAPSTNGDVSSPSTRTYALPEPQMVPSLPSPSAMPALEAPSAIPSMPAPIVSPSLQIPESVSPTNPDDGGGRRVDLIMEPNGIVSVSQPGSGQGQGNGSGSGGVPNGSGNGNGHGAGGGGIGDGQTPGSGQGDITSPGNSITAGDIAQFIGSIASLFSGLGGGGNGGGSSSGSGGANGIASGQPFGSGNIPRPVPTYLPLPGTKVTSNTPGGQTKPVSPTNNPGATSAFLNVFSGLIPGIAVPPTVPLPSVPVPQPSSSNIETAFNTPPAPTETPAEKPKEALPTPKDSANEVQKLADAITPPAPKKDVPTDTTPKPVVNPDGQDSQIKPDEKEKPVVNPMDQQPPTKLTGPTTLFNPNSTGRDVPSQKEVSPSPSFAEQFASGAQKLADGVGSILSALVGVSPAMAGEYDGPLPLQEPYLAAIKRIETSDPTAPATWDVRQNTNGYGTKARYPGEQIGEEEANARFLAEMTNARNFVDGVAVGWDEGTKAALTSLTFNAGEKWASDGLGGLVKSGNPSNPNDVEAVRDRFLMYKKSDGVVLRGLESRRIVEASWIGHPLPGGDTPPMANGSHYASPYRGGPIAESKVPIGGARLPAGENPHNVERIAAPSGGKENIAFCIGTEKCGNGTQFNENNYVSPKDSLSPAAIDAKIANAVAHASESGGRIEVDDGDTAGAAKTQELVNKSLAAGLQPWVNNPHLITDGKVTGYKGLIFEADSTKTVPETLAEINAARCAAGDCNMPALAVGTKDFTDAVAAAGEPGIGTSESSKEGNTPGAYSDVKKVTAAGTGSANSCEGKVCITSERTGVTWSADNTDAGKAEIARQDYLEGCVQSGVCHDDAAIREFTVEQVSGGTETQAQARVRMTDELYKAYLDNTDQDGKVKDEIAARHAGMTVPQFLFSKMSNDTVAMLYNIKKGVEADGLPFTISSASRDYFRQSMAGHNIAYHTETDADGKSYPVLDSIGAKTQIAAAPGHSNHERENGGAVDVNREAARWVAQHPGTGFYQPLPTSDAVHIARSDTCEASVCGGLSTAQVDAIAAKTWTTIAPPPEYVVRDGDGNVVMNGAQFPTSVPNGPVELVVDGLGKPVFDAGGKPLVVDSSALPQPVTTPDGRLVFADNRPPPSEIARTGGGGDTSGGYARGLSGGTNGYDPNGTQGLDPHGSGGSGGGSGGGGSPSGGGQQTAQPTPPPVQNQNVPPINFSVQLQPVLSCNPGAVLASTSTPVTVSWTCFQGVARSTDFVTNDQPQGSTRIAITASSSASTRTLAVRCIVGNAVSLPAQCTMRTVRPIVTLTASPAQVYAGSATTLRWAGSDVDRCNIYAPGQTLVAQGGASGTTQTPILQRSVIMRAVCHSAAGININYALAVQVVGDTQAPLDTPPPQDPFSTVVASQVYVTSPLPTSQAPTVSPQSTSPSTIETPCDPETSTSEFIACLQNAR